MTKRRWVKNKNCIHNNCNHIVVKTWNQIRVSGKHDDHGDDKEHETVGNTDFLNHYLWQQYEMISLNPQWDNIIKLEKILLLSKKRRLFHPIFLTLSNLIGFMTSFLQQTNVVSFGVTLFLCDSHAHDTNECWRLTSTLFSSKICPASCFSS